ncbi:hypothetical protein BDQ17DRAFT_1348978 [Cyathus striatus]|nr:hypothetical protein BDQ17DRAFT_1348978 [Cyathus striatus]
MSSITNPAQLVDAFKKSGEFDRLRKELLADFQRTDDGLASFKSKIADIARQRLASDQTLHFMPHESVHRELMQEVDRYPIVERAAAEAPMLSDSSFTAGVTTSVRNILYQAKGITPNNEMVQISPISTDRPTHPPKPTSTFQDSTSVLHSETSAAPNVSSLATDGSTAIPLNTVSPVHAESSNFHSSASVLPLSADAISANEIMSIEASFQNEDSDPN